MRVTTVLCFLWGLQIAESHFASRVLAAIGFSERSLRRRVTTDASLFTGVAFVMHGSGKLGEVVDFSAEYPRARFYGRGDCEDDRREVRGDIPHPKRHVAASELHPARHPTPVHGHISFIN